MLLEQRVANCTAELRGTVQELESFSYSISHDLRAPLRAMLGYAEVAAKAGMSCLQPLRSIFSSLWTAVSGLTAWCRTFWLTAKSRALTSSLSPPKARIRVQSPLLPVRAHEALLAQCITNLLSNAVKFVQPGTIPEVTIRSERSANGKGVRLWIEDNGIGIEPQNLRRIFNIFERIHSAREFPGTGIGLAIVRKAVERMGGLVGVESELGNGSRFWIE